MNVRIQHYYYSQAFLRVFPTKAFLRANKRSQKFVGFALFALNSLKKVVGVVERTAILNFLLKIAISRDSSMKMVGGVVSLFREKLRALLAKTRIQLLKVRKIKSTKFFTVAGFAGLFGLRCLLKLVQLVDWESPLFSGYNADFNCTFGNKQEFFFRLRHLW